ncbi:AraC family transcriptional regulator [Halomonas sp. SCS19]|uniref:helix-turn-helix transcriptional regulator n=1 Tax=Halomonas sp. SCS19 TaxID=2950870 RepID=UPI0032DFCAA2
MPPRIAATFSRYLRDPRMPQVEARRVRGGHRLSHAPHSHDTHSLGAIVQGHSSFLNRHRTLEVRQGDVVLINPGDVHACNALSERDWGYDMLYLDSAWLTERCGLDGDDGAVFSALTTQDAHLHQAIRLATDALADGDASLLERETVLERLAERLTGLLDLPARGEAEHGAPPERLVRVWERLHDDWQQELRLDDLCAAAECRATSLISGFRRHYATTPHAALIDLRVRHARQRLRRGDPIAAVANDCGFADQAHLQRTFKKLLATTPGHYIQGQMQDQMPGPLKGQMPGPLKGQIQHLKQRA